MRKTLICSCAVLFTATLGATPAGAQTPPSPGASSPVINLWYGGLITGAEAVQKSGGVIGGEAGARVWKNLDLFLEGGSLSDVVPQRQIDAASPLTTFLQARYGQAAQADVKMPAAYFSFGGRWVFEQVVLAGWARPYVEVGVGGARVKREPTFTLGGTNITSSLSQYGVTIGSDLTATDKRAAVTFGVGVVVPYRMLYFSTGYRNTSIQTPTSIGVNRLHIGIGARF